MNTEAICKQIVAKLVEDGYVHQLRKKDLKQAIMEVRQCIDSRTIKQWTEALVTFNFLIIDNPSGIFKLNPIKIPDLMVKIHEKAQTKLL